MIRTRGARDRDVNRYQVKARRSGDWWALSVDEHPGIHSQVRSLRQAETMIKEAISLALDEDPDTFAVAVTHILPKDLR